MGRLKAHWLAPLAALALISMARAADAPIIGGDSHQPVPRFASLKIEGAVGRRGPGADQPAQWVYQLAGLPLLITGESGPWRRVRDPDGAEVWMRASNLDERRTVLVRGDHDAALHRDPQSNSRTLALLAPGVVGAMTGCDGIWRRVAVGGRVGWVRQDALWAAGEACPTTP